MRVDDAVQRTSGSVRPANRKESILRIATTQFLREGYHRTSMVDIAAQIGITSTALYRHFRNKEELLARCVLSGLDRAAAGLANTRTLDEIIDALAASAYEHRELPALWQREIRYLPRDAQRVTQAGLASTVIRIRDALATPRPELPTADAELLAWCVLATFDSISHHHVTLPAEDVETLVASLSHRVANVELPDRPSGIDELAIEPVIPTRDQEHEPSRRDRLLAAAARLFSRHGYAAVGIDDIGAAAGITGPSVYYHFARKSDLLSEIMDRAAGSSELYSRLALDGAQSPGNALERFVGYYLSFAFTHRELVWVAVSEISHLPPEIAAKHRQRQRESIARWVRALRVVRSDLDDEHARIVVQAVLMIINDVVRLRQLRNRPLIRDELFAIGMAMQLPNGTPSEGDTPKFLTRKPSRTHPNG